MWDAIAANQRRSWVLIILMGMVLLGLGAAIGGAVGASLESAAVGTAVALVIWLLLWAVALAQGDHILLASARARKIGPDDHPQLWNVVEEMKIASGLAAMPAVYIINDAVPNAFAMGRHPDKCAVAVTTGLMKRLDRDELQGVIAHEIGHIVNRDTRFLMIAGIMLGAIVLIAHGFLRGMLYGSAGRSRSSRNSGGGQAQLILLVLSLVLAILAPLLAQMLYFACSRKREYLADASGALFTRYPAGLASALEKISSGIITGRRHRGEKSTANKVLAPMYIINPLEALAAAGLFSTHPPTRERVAILRSMAGASFADYDVASKSVRKSGCIGARTLRESKPAEIRKPAAGSTGEEKARETVERLRDVGLLTGRLDDFVAFACICGVGIRVPPGSKRSEIRCPRCGENNKVPSAEKPGSGGDSLLRYRRKGKIWESFRCNCGASVQLSPTFSASHIHCPKCRDKIAVES